MIAGETIYKMKATSPKSIALATSLLVGSALAGHLLQVIGIPEFVDRRLSQGEDAVSWLRLDSESQKHVKYWRNRLLDESLQVVGPCRLPEDAAHECKAPTFPLFPLPDYYRNALLGRPPPDIVRANIEQATKRELSSVDELIEAVNANLHNLDVLGDDSLALLATNFREPEAGLAVRVGCGPINYGEWPEDLLVSQDEQRALTAGFLYALGDPGYLGRRDAELQQYIKHHVKPRQEEQCQADVRGGANQFRERVKQLDTEVLIPEAEWLARYNEYVAALRAELYGMVSGSKQGWDHFTPKIEDIVSVSEDIVGEMVEEGIPMAEMGFIRFLDENYDEIRREFQELHPGIVRRVAYRRWKTLPQESQAAYLQPR